jgi:hypothetical protein
VPSAPDSEGMLAIGLSSWGGLQPSSENQMMEQHFSCNWPLILRWVATAKVLCHSPQFQAKNSLYRGYCTKFCDISTKPASSELLSWSVTIDTWTEPGKRAFCSYKVWNEPFRKALLQSLPVAKIEWYNHGAKSLCSGIDINSHIIMNINLVRKARWCAICFCGYRFAGRFCQI